MRNPSINEKSKIVWNNDDGYPERLLFCGEDSWSQLSVRSFVTDSRTAQGGRVQWVITHCGKCESGGSRILGLDCRYKHMWNIRLSVSRYKYGHDGNFEGYVRQNVI